MTLERVFLNLRFYNVFSNLNISQLVQKKLFLNYCFTTSFEKNLNNVLNNFDVISRRGI